PTDVCGPTGQSGQTARIAAVTLRQEQLIALRKDEFAAVWRPRPRMPHGFAETARPATQDRQGPKGTIECGSGLVGNEERIAVRGYSENLHAQSRSRNRHYLSAGAGHLADGRRVADDRRRVLQIKA